MKGYLLVLNFAVIFSVAAAITGTNSSTDQTALLALKVHINHDPHNFLTNNWSITSPICSWIGVTCGHRHPTRVVSLNLSYMDLNGTIPLQLANLSFLSFLSLRNNNFYGHLTNELRHLRRLKFLDFGFNFFSGTIPSSFFSSLPKLKILSLEANDFSGNFTLSSTNISSLKVLNISHNPNLGFLPFNIFNISTLQVVDISYGSLYAKLPMDIFNHLPDLREIHLCGNIFYGEIPRSLFKCRKLQVLSLSSNKFTGSIPAELGNLTVLNKLYLDNNFLNGKIPQEIGYLTKMEYMSILNNHITGSIPTSIRYCTLLKEINLSQNYLTGSIPPEISDLRNLEVVRIHDNDLRGNIPPALCNISRLKVIDLNVNNLSGNLPLSVGLFLPNLLELRLAENAFDGTIPNSISNASQITYLDLSENSFTGFFPSTLSDLRYLQTLNLGNNRLMSDGSTEESSFLSSLAKFRNLKKVLLSNNLLNSTLPVSFGNLSSTLQEFRANNCSIKGSIPRDIGNLTSLIALSWEYNQLTDTIPSKIGTLQNLQGLFLQGNSLEGAIANDVCNLHNLFELSLAGNRLSGAIPKCLGNLTTLRHLNLSSNNFTSKIPSTLWSLADILTIDMSSNFMIGNLPIYIGNLKSVVKIDFSRNQLSDEIPSTIGALKSVAYLSLAKNLLQGSIPQSLGGSVSLEWLDLSHNHLSGVLPKSLQALLYLRYFNVSFNGLQGEIPREGPFINFSAQSYMMNKALCGSPQLQVPPCKTDILQIRSLLRILLPIIASIGLAYYAFEGLRMHKRNISNRQMVGILADLKMYYEYGNMHINPRRATDGFNEDNLIGTGHFASVYKGICENGTQVAMKVYDIKDERSLRSFNVESSILEKHRHRNIIRTFGSCNGLTVKALVMEYMSNGSLENWLHTHNYHLDILQRLEIMMDVASAVKYVHDFNVVHCDLKPGNVLLGEDMIARVCDFGIAHDLDSEETALHNTAIMCTFGYAAPEYGLLATVSKKVDVYSFGIVLMETFTGKRPTDEMFSGEMSLTRWVDESLPSHGYRVVDPSLLRNEEQHFDAKVECLTKIMTLAKSCSAQSPLERFDMNYVLDMLQRIQKRFLKNISGD